MKKDIGQLDFITSVIEEFLASDFEAIAMQAVNNAAKQKAQEEAEALAGFSQYLSPSFYLAPLWGKDKPQDLDEQNKMPTHQQN